ncbi:phytanoyl-CoA dioxygenase [Salinisphaera sp. USBA-960]|nr:phytanoyl-CoA dioxygenase [Salifodinibacter halophilus]NNC25674.1 phytanoyl-CoA dioxygenase [Salifodinibacter halophilus]
MSDQACTHPAWLTADACDIESFIAEVNQTTQPADYPYADHIEHNVPIYDGPQLAERIVDPDTARDIQAEWVQAMRFGPGIVVFKQAFAAETIDQTTRAFDETLAQQKANNVASGDHFAKPGANDRLWRAQQKLAEHAPDTYAAYYANPLLAAVCEAWLGPMYQMTSDLNIVNPGGEAQNPHRDYHLGFMPSETAQRFPAHAHELSPMLTLQGAVAHCDMPIESGPTLYLPYSQRYLRGFLGIQYDVFREYFANHYVQLPLNKGDAVFFSPALFHGAGHNISRDIYRSANLLQVSSAFGRALGTMNRTRLCRALYPTLQTLQQAGHTADVQRVIAASAEGYGFPTNLDRDQPIGGISPETQVELVTRALSEGLPYETFVDQLEAQAQRQRVDD